jgi:hypothetical protein
MLTSVFQELISPALPLANALPDHLLVGRGTDKVPLDPKAFDRCRQRANYEACSTTVQTDSGPKSQWSLY